MRLVNKHTNQPVLEFQGEKTIFHSKFLENEMRSMGVPIPHGLRGIYHGKNCIRLEDEQFQKAFKEIYYITTMNPEVFQWCD